MVRRNRRAALLLVVAPPRRCRRAGVVCLVRRERDVCERGRSSRRRPRRSRRTHSRRDRQSLAGATAGPRQDERACVRCPHGRGARRGARREARRPRRADRRERHRGLPTALTMRAKKRLGQHFLVDENILGVIGRLAELADDDVVLEIGPGLGVLTTFLADRVAQVYAVELDTSLGPQLVERLAGRPNVELRFGDALKLDLTEVAPGARKLVANLPYNIATPLVVESLDGLPEIDLWCVMVQREVADRFFAVTSTKAYGAVSVLIQLVAERTGFHAVSRNVFRPRPNVESAIVAFRRTGLPPDFGHVKSIVEASFAHRRKKLANSLELSGIETTHARVPDVRAEELTPADFLALARVLG